MRKTILFLSAALLIGTPIHRAFSALLVPTPAASTTAAPAAVKAPKPHADGIVTAVDAAAQSVTVTNKKGVATTFTLAPKAVIMKRTVGTLAAIKVGDRVQVASKTEIVEGATTVTAAEISILPPAPKKATSKATGYRKHIVGGDVTALTPLTIVTSSATPVTVTVTTSATTKVFAEAPATFADITVGKLVNANGEQGPTGLIAKHVHISPAPVKKAGK